MMKMRYFLIAGLLMAGACASTNQGAGMRKAGNARELLTQMHDVYEGKWYRTLTFIQKTTIERPGKAAEHSTWYEAIKAPGLLRIDFNDPKLGNGVLYTPDSIYIMRAGKLARTNPGGNEFMPLTVGVYTQDVAKTIRELEDFKFDLNAFREDVWQGRPVYVVGARDASDLESAQFWIDRERLVLVRMIKKLDPSPGAKPYDIQLDKYVALGTSWLPTYISIVQPGVVSQLEEYTEWKADVELPADFFRTDKWLESGHWHK